MKPVSGPAELTVTLAGAPLSEADAACLASIQVSQRACLPAQAEVVFRGASAELADLVAVLPGLGLTASTGTPLFEGEVTAVEQRYGPDGGIELRVRAYDALHRMRKRQSVRVFTELDCADLARQLASEIGVEVEAGVAGPVWPRLVQWRQSDFTLLAECAFRSGVLFAMDDNRLRLFDLDGVGDACSLRLGEELLEAEFELNGEGAAEAVTATGWDPATGQRFEQTAQSPRSGRTAGARITSTELGGLGTRMLPNAAVPGAEHAAVAAQARLDVAEAGTVVVRGVAQGDPGIRPGGLVDIAGVAAAFNGRYVVTQAVHTIDAERGALSQFSTAPPGPPVLVAHPILAPGVVERVDDPDARGRVLVSLPTLPSVESGWLRVLVPGAGAGKGLVTLPDVGDEVLILFPGGDPAFGIVLGGLYGDTEHPELGVVEERVRRHTWRTAAGQEIQLDDAGQQLIVRTPNGSALTMAEELFTVHSATDLEITAPGRTLTITAGAVDFRKG